MKTEPLEAEAPEARPQGAERIRGRSSSRPGPGHSVLPRRAGRSIDGLSFSFSLPTSSDYPIFSCRIAEACHLRASPLSLRATLPAAWERSDQDCSGCRPPGTSGRKEHGTQSRPLRHPRAGATARTQRLRVMCLAPCRRKFLHVDRLPVSKPRHSGHLRMVRHYLLRHANYLNNMYLRASCTALH